MNLVKNLWMDKDFPIAVWNFLLTCNVFGETFLRLQVSNK